MLKNRKELSEFLRSVLGINRENVFFQPPESLKLKYPCIIYELSRYNTTKADNKSYIIRDAYTVTLITKTPDTEISKKILEVEGCSFDRVFINDNLYHYVFEINL